LLMSGLGTFAFGQAQHVGWDIVSVDFTTTPITANPNGFADAIAPNNGGKIRLTGFGTFVAPAGQRGGGSATGGGTWETSDIADNSTGSGTYDVTKLVRFELANFQTPGTILDNIGNEAERANGYAVLRIQYDDGPQGVLGVYCHGPGAPAGIAEGISATKGFVTYVEVQGPSAGVDANRTLFHVH
jgi:hypothetical protein